MSAFRFCRLFPAKEGLIPRDVYVSAHTAMSEILRPDLGCDCLVFHWSLLCVFFEREQWNQRRVLCLLVRKMHNISSALHDLWEVSEFMRKKSPMSNREAVSWVHSHCWSVLGARPSTTGTSFAKKFWLCLNFILASF